MTRKKLLKISELARRAQVSTRTIHFYVQEGLLPPPFKTARNMAYYHPSSVQKVLAIRKAQAERFLPLVVIGRLLKESGYDYSVLNGAKSAALEEESSRDHELLDQVPGPLLKKFTDRGWLGSTAAPNWSPSEKRLVSFAQKCSRLGLSLETVVQAFEEIEGLVEKVVQAEYQTFLCRLSDDQAEGFDVLMAREKGVVQDFIGRVRESYLAEILTSHNRALNNAVLAIGDEGYGIPLETVGDRIKKLEGQIPRRSPDTDLLVDLATGYSCVGDQDRAMALLQKALRRDPHHLRAKVRWCWYHRFSEDRRNPNYWRDRLKRLTEANPDDVDGRVFLSLWYAFDSTEAPDSSQALQYINICLTELKKAEELPPPDLHVWVLLTYAKGLIYTYVLASLGEQEQGVRAFESILARRGELEQYYANRLWFFPDWLWPNLLCFLGLAHLEAGRWSEARDKLSAAHGFKVSSLFRQRVEAGLAAAEKGLALESAGTESQGLVKALTAAGGGPPRPTRYGVIVHKEEKR
ncbi:MAG: MerR family transcriptional regulator [Thermodesulfobacteriota bacterium]